MLPVSVFVSVFVVPTDSGVSLNLIVTFLDPTEVSQSIVD